MSTKQVNTTQGQYNPAAMGQYNSLQPVFGNAIQSEINDPYTNMFFNTQLAMGRQSNAQQLASQQSALLQRSQALGINPQSGSFQQQLTDIQRQGMASNSGLYQNLLLQAGQLRQSALGMAENYRPLQTGQTQTQTQSGLGSWLPQVAGAGLGIAGGILSGGMTGFMGGGGMNPQSAMLASQNPQMFNGYQPEPTMSGYGEGMSGYQTPGMNFMNPFTGQTMNYQY